MAKQKLQIFEFKDWESFGQQVRNMIAQKESFAVMNVPTGKQSTAVEVVERTIESVGMKCRVRTANRGWAVGALTVLTLGGAAAAAVAVGVHDLVTINPNYEIIKEMFGSDIQVEYMKSSELKSDKE